MRLGIDINVLLTEDNGDVSLYRRKVTRVPLIGELIELEIEDGKLITIINGIVTNLKTNIDTGYISVYGYILETYTGASIKNDLYSQEVIDLLD